MNVEKKQADRDELRQHAASEVIELGEMLFDMAIDAAALRPAGGEEVDALLIEEMRVAAGEFFTALGLLLGNGEQAITGRVSGVEPQIPLE